MTKFFTLSVCMLALISASACTLDEPTWVNPTRVEVHEEGYQDSFDTSALDEGTLHAIGVNYYRYGNGPMDVSVSYDPQSRTNTKQNAEKQARKIENELSRNGVKNMRVSTSAVTSSAEKSTTMISFPALTAKPPENCGMMPGYTDAQMQVAENAEGGAHGYQIGCTVESLLAKQISRPGDLLGRPGFETNADGRRQEAVLWKRGYYSEKSNGPLMGQDASKE